MAYKRTWHRHRLTKIEGEHILWHVMDYLRMAGEAGYQDAYEARILVVELMNEFFT